MTVEAKHGFTATAADQRAANTLFTVQIGTPGLPTGVTLTGTDAAAASGWYAVGAANAAPSAA